MKLEQKVLGRKNKNKNRKKGGYSRQSAADIDSSRIKGNIGFYLVDRMEYAYTKILPTEAFTPWVWDGGMPIQPLGQKPKLAFMKADGDIDSIETLYRHYTDGSMMRKKNEWNQDWHETHDPKWVKSQHNRWNVSDYDDFAELTQPHKRYLNLKVEQFMTFMDYLKTISDGYRKGLLKWLKQMTTKNEYPAWVASIDVSGNNAYTETGTELSRKTLSEIYKYLRALKDWDDPDKPSAFFPGVLWFGGRNIKVTGDLDIQTMVLPKLVDDILVLQKRYESEIFDATIPKYLDYFKRINDSLLTKLNKQTSFIDNITTNLTAAQMENLTDEDERVLKAEFDRQMSIPGFKLNILGTKDTSAEHQGSRTGSQVIVANIGGTGVDKYNNWKRQFILSYEYKEFIGEVNKGDLDDLEKYKENFVDADKVDIEKLSKEKTFFQADVFANEDEESMNLDIIEKLRTQENDYNQQLKTAEATYKAQEEAHQTEVKKGLDDLKKKLIQAKDKTLADIQAAVEKNKANDLTRKKVEGERQRVAAQIEQNQDALMKLKNYSGCDTQPPLKVPPKAVLKDAGLRDLIKASEDNLKNVLSGGKKKSIKEWYYELNQKYIGGVDENMDNNAQGYNINVQGDEDIGAVSYSGAVSGIGNTSVEDGVAMAGVAIELISMALPPPANAIGMLIGGIMSLAGDLAGKAKQEELEKQRRERERQIASFASWKQQAEDQVVSFLEGETDNDKFKASLKKAVDAFAARDPSNPPSDGAIKTYKREIIETRKANMEIRQNISDTIAENTKDVVRELLDLLKDHDDNMEYINEEIDNERNEYIEAYTTEIKTLIDTFAKDQEKLAADLVAAQAKNRSDAELLQVALPAIQQNTVTPADIAKDIKAQNAANEEAVAQGAKDVPPATIETVVPGTTTASGKPYKRKNVPKNSIANQIYMLNMNYIKSF
jgi:hypothetical protein